MAHRIRRPAWPLRLLPWLVVLGACAPRPDPLPEESERTPVPADHHVHLLSPALVADWKSLGVPFSRPDSVYVSASSLLGSPPGDGPEPGRARQALLLPMAHLYGRAEFRQALALSEAEEHARVRRENDHVAREAARFPGRAVAFCSVDPFRPYARAELRRCREELGSAGVKLHLASAGTDLRDPAHLRELADVAAWAESEGAALVLHFDPQRRGLDVEDVERFIASVLQPHPDLVVSVAHLGGSGGYGPWTRSVFHTFLGWLEAEAAEGRPRPGVFFDLSAVWLEEESEGVPPSTPADAVALRADLARVDTGRLVFGSDYPVFDPVRYARTLRDTVGLDASTWEAIMRNRLPVLPRDAVDPAP